MTVESKSIAPAAKRRCSLKRMVSGGALAFSVVCSWGIAPTAHAVFDDLELSARARGLGGSYAGLSDRADGVFYNPAGLVNVTDYDFTASLFELFNLSFLRVNAFAVAVPTERWGTFGIGYADLRVEYENTTLSIERTVTASHGIMLMEDLSSSLALGYSVNVYNVDYPTVSVTGLDLGSETTFGLDVGFLAKLQERTTAGVFYKNLNNPEIGVAATDLPQRISGGLAYRPYDGVITAAEVEKELGEAIQFHGGVEFEVAEPLRLRFGAQTKPNLFDAGVALAYRNLVVDVAYTHHPVLDATLHYGLGIRF